LCLFVASLKEAGCHALQVHKEAQRANLLFARPCICFPDDKHVQT
jgi:hypothetical protein